MRTIRYNTFETNSSSTHSLAVPKKVEHIPSDVRFHFGDFGWQLEDCIDPADYLYTGIVTGSQEIREKYLPKLKEVMERNNIRLSVSCSNSSYYIHAPDVSPYHSIGDYKSKERCIAVLDEIQHSLEIGTIIFEMPKE